MISKLGLIFYLLLIKSSKSFKRKINDVYFYYKEEGEEKEVTISCLIENKIDAFEKENMKEEFIEVDGNKIEIEKITKFTLKGYGSKLLKKNFFGKIKKLVIDCNVEDYVFWIDSTIQLKGFIDFTGKLVLRQYATIFLLFDLNFENINEVFIYFYEAKKEFQWLDKFVIQENSIKNNNFYFISDEKNKEFFEKNLKIKFKNKEKVHFQTEEEQEPLKTPFYKDKLVWFSCFIFISLLIVLFLK